MGVDIDIFFDHDMGKLNAQEFLAELKQRSGKEVFLTNGFCFCQTIKDGICVSFMEETFEKAYSNIEMGLDIKIFENGNCVPLNITYAKNAIGIITDDEFEGDLSGRWNLWLKDIYAENGAEKVRKKIGYMKKVLVPIFHCTQVMMCGDSFGYDLIADSLFFGKTIEETIEYAMYPYHENPKLPKNPKNSFIV